MRGFLYYLQAVPDRALWLLALSLLPASVFASREVRQPPRGFIYPVF